MPALARRLLPACLAATAAACERGPAWEPPPVTHHRETLLRSPHAVVELEHTIEPTLHDAIATFRVVARRPRLPLAVVLEGTAEADNVCGRVTATVLDATDGPCVAVAREATVCVLARGASAARCVDARDASSVDGARGDARLRHALVWRAGDADAAVDVRAWAARAAVRAGAGGEVVPLLTRLSLDAEGWTDKTYALEVRALRLRLTHDRGEARRLRGEVERGRWSEVGAVARGCAPELRDAVAAREAVAPEGLGGFFREAHAWCGAR